MYAGGVVDGTLGDADGLGGDGRPGAVQGVHGDREALPFLADPVLGGDPDVIQDHLAGRAAVDAHLALQLADLQPHRLSTMKR